MADLLRFFAFYVNNLTLKSFSCMLLVASFRISLIMAEKIIAFYFNNLTLWPIHCNFLHFMSIIYPCECDNLKGFSCIFPKFVMHVTNDQFSDRFNNEKNQNGWFIDFTSTICPCWRDNMKIFPFILLKFVMHMFSDKFDNGWEKLAYLLWFLAFYVNNLTFWAP